MPNTHNKSDELLILILGYALYLFDLFKVKHWDVLHQTFVGVGDVVFLNISKCCLNVTGKS